MPPAKLLFMNVRVNLGLRSYEIQIRANDSAGLGPFAAKLTPGRAVLVVTDENVRAHAENLQKALDRSQFRTGLVVLKPGEDQKTLATAAQLYDRLVELRADRRTLVLAVGGGVIGDVAGFAAATFARGLPLLSAPTTLLAMVDSSVGGKVGVNHPRAKNLIGAFHQPVGVWIDLETLRSLPEREFRSGLAEVVKYGVILDAEFFAYLEEHSVAILKREPNVLEHIVARCCRLKADVVERDEREESGLRALLNYGHTFGHAFEAIGGYGNWLHGEAVSAGMICASRLAELRGLIHAEVSARQKRLLETFGLPVAPLAWPAGELLEAMSLDKKVQNGRMRFVLPERIGKASLVEAVPRELVERVLSELLPSRVES
jgi:3-dehydroquinate synthase